MDDMDKKKSKKSLNGVTRKGIASMKFWNL